MHKTQMQRPSYVNLDFFFLKKNCLILDAVQLKPTKILLKVPNGTHENVAHKKCVQWQLALMKMLLTKYVYKQICKNNYPIPISI